MIRRDGILLTDLYQLTMLQTYHDCGMTSTAVFEFFVRKLPPNRNFLIAAGLEQVLEYLESVFITPEELDWLARCGRFRKDFVDSLADFRFTGDVDAVAEGTVFFADEPILRVTAPIMQAQLVETRIINLLQLQTLVASKAARCVLAAPGKLIVDFGLRRSHGAEAGLLAARASYIAGFQGTSAVVAGALWDIPLYGTMAHSFIQAHESEAGAFEDFARSHPTNCVMLIDTYDTEAGARHIVQLADKLRRDGIEVPAVRIDSGDLADHARKVRAILDSGGCGRIRVFASGNLDEYRLRELLAVGAPIDGFGVGTRMNTSADHPYLDCAYKLQEYAGQPRRKRSEGKATWPGRKQVFRQSANGIYHRDMLTTTDEEPGGEALIVPVMREGRRLAPSPPLKKVRDDTARQLDRLPAALRSLDPAPAYPVIVSDKLRQAAAAVDLRTRSA